MTCRLAPLTGAAAAGWLITSLDHSSWIDAYVAVALVLVSVVGGFALSSEIIRLSIRLTEKTTERWDVELIGLASRTPYIRHYEDPQYLDQLELLRSQPRALGQLAPSLAGAYSFLFQAIILTALLVAVKPMLVIIVVAALPTIVAMRRAEDLTQRQLEHVAADRRLANHFFFVATTADNAEEVRVHGLRQLLEFRERETWRSYERSCTSTDIKATALVTAARLILIAGYVGSLLFLILDGNERHVEPGTVVFAILIAGTISGQLGQIVESCRRSTSQLRIIDRVEWLRSITQLPSDSAASTQKRVSRTVPPVLADGISIEAVSFSYPSAGRTVLKDVNLTLRAGSVVAIVGENGAGKTTLIKLLAGMYRPDEGSIRVDGVDLNDFDIEEWRSKISAVFQDASRFELIVRDAVEIGELSRYGDHALTLAAVRGSGLESTLQSLPNGIDTQLGTRWPSGVDLSGGQWQTVGLARSMMRREPLLLILDEPSASLDPLAERSLFRRYAELSRRARVAVGSVTLLISHRFSTVQLADEIVVFADGEVLEVGSHERLLAARGQYAELFELYERGYR